MKLKTIGIISCLIFSSVQQTCGMFDGLANKWATAKERLSNVPTSLLGVGGAITFVGTTVLTGGMSLPLIGLGAYCAYYKSYCKMDTILARCDRLGIQIEGVESRLGEKITSLADTVREESKLTRSEISVCQVGISAIGKAVIALKERDLPELRDGLVADNDKTRSLCNQRFNSLELQFTGAVEEITSCVSSLTMLSSDDGHLHMILDKMRDVQTSLEKQTGEFAEIKAKIASIETKIADILEKQQLHEAKILSKMQKDKEDSARLFNQVLDQGEETKQKLDETRKEVGALRTEFSLLHEMMVMNQGLNDKRYTEWEQQAQKTEQDLEKIKQGVTDLQSSVTGSKNEILDALSESGRALISTKNNKKRTKTLPYPNYDEDNYGTEKMTFESPGSCQDKRSTIMSDAVPVRMTALGYWSASAKRMYLENFSARQVPLSTQVVNDFVNLPPYYLSFEQDRQLIESLSKSGDVRKAVRTQSGPASVGRNISEHSVNDTLQIQVQSSHRWVGGSVNALMYLKSPKIFRNNPFPNQSIPGPLILNGSNPSV